MLAYQPMQRVIAREFVRFFPLSHTLQSATVTANLPHLSTLYHRLNQEARSRDQVN